jgi:hypothetical protein
MQGESGVAALLPSNSMTKGLSLLTTLALTLDFQLAGIEICAAADSPDAEVEEPLVLAMSLQQRALQAVQALSLQLPQNPITANPPAPISLSGEPEHLPHLPPPPPAPRLYSVDATDLQVTSGLMINA